jgi:hypothetical protein
MTMNIIEQLAITFILEVLQEIVKNPAKKAELQTQLLNIAGNIAATYGYTLTPPSPITDAKTATK